MLTALNALNVVDFLYTEMLVGAGVAREGNPIAAGLGGPGKLLLVASASALLWLVRPRALIAPAVAYAVVVAYSVAGALLFTQAP